MKKRKFYICRNDTIREVQYNFSHFFPQLEINIFSNNEKNVPKDSLVMFSPDVCIRKISPDCRDGCFEITDNMTVDQLESLFQDNFKLHAEITTKPAKRLFAIPQVQFFRIPERSHLVHYKSPLSEY